MPAGSGPACAPPRHAVDETDEARFVDALDRNLRDGAFLLLIVGDGIREDIEGIADLLRQHPGLRFHLALVELRLFRPQSTPGELLILPAVVGRTREVTRAVIKVDRTIGSPHVAVEVETNEPDGRPGRIESPRSTTSRDEPREYVPEGTAAGIVGLARWWQGRGGRIRFNKRSINFAAPFAGTTAKLISVMSVYEYGTAEGSVAPLSTWRNALSPETTLERFRAAGFEGGPEFPQRPIDPSDPRQDAVFKDLLSWAFEAVAATQRPASQPGNNPTETTP